MKDRKQISKPLCTGTLVLSNLSLVNHTEILHTIDNIQPCTGVWLSSGSGNHKKATGQVKLHIILGI